MNTGSTDSLAPSSLPKVLVIIGAVAAAVPFGLSMSSSSQMIVNGEVVPGTYRDSAGDAAREDKNLTKACELYLKACDFGEGASCNYLAVAYANGEGVEKDPVKGRADGCNNLGDLMHRGLGDPKDRVGAKKMFQKACDAGDEMGCKNLKVAK